MVSCMIAFYFYVSDRYFSEAGSYCLFRLKLAWKNLHVFPKFPSLYESCIHVLNPGPHNRLFIPFLRPKLLTFKVYHSF